MALIDLFQFFAISHFGLYFIHTQLYFHKCIVEYRVSLPLKYYSDWLSPVLYMIRVLACMELLAGEDIRWFIYEARCHD